MNKIALVLICFLILVSIQVVKADDSFNDSLIKAAADCNLSKAKYALSHGADIDAQNSSVILAATVPYGQHGRRHRASDCISVIKLLLDHGVDVNSPTGNNGMTALMTATLVRPKLSMVKFLISHGANVNAQGKNGWTALMLASLAGDINIIKLLLSHGADVNIKSDEGDTALSIAETNKHINLVRYSEVIRLLKAAGAKK
jgi:ankyrin repeat protein